MSIKIIVLFALVLAVSCGREDPAQQRASDLARACLNVVRLEQQAMAQGTDPAGALGQVESSFIETVELDPLYVKAYVISGRGRAASQLEYFLKVTGKVPEVRSKDDPAAVVMKIFSEAPETSGRGRGLIEGYAAAFQMCLELERDGTVMQDFLPFLLALGCPMTLRDHGLENATRERLEELGAEAAGLTGKRAYATEPFDFFITMVKINNWASRYSGQVTADTLAARLVASPEITRLVPKLKEFPELKIGFLGDSHMDSRHWCSPAPFPDIIAAVFRQVNPRVTVINAGRGGDDTREALKRIDKDLVAKGPSLSFIMLGGNDCRHWGKPEPAVNPAQHRRNINEMTGRLRAADSHVTLMSNPCYPSLEGLDLEVLLKINSQLEQARDSLKTNWVDVCGLLADNDPGDMYAVDRIHLRPEAHLKIAWVILEYLTSTLTIVPGPVL
ncbi:MAG: GDSL-type esterase/lipase family protein [Gemmatimonadota bacterium]|nr:GDSL-type esterase/lipase family protein [Gemmatimonadota bacterium]